MGQRPPFETFKGPICKGSYSLGSACGICEKCIWERKQLGIRLEVADREPHDDLRNAIDEFFKHQGCPANECDDKIVIDRISARELVDKILRQPVTPASWLNLADHQRGEVMDRIKHNLDLAKREPGHSPTEDALIDAFDALLDFLRLT